MSKEDKGKVKMTVIHFETESDNATLQANIHAIAQTLTRALAPPRIQPPAQLGNGNGSGSSELSDADEADFDSIDGEIVPASTSTKSSKPKGQITYRSPLVLDLDLASGDMPLQTFFDNKKPDSEAKKYLVIASWFKDYRSIEEVTMDHIHTAYRFLKLNTPKDASSPLRNLKSQGWMKKGSDKGAYSINHIGENEVNNMG